MEKVRKDKQQWIFSSRKNKTLDIEEFSKKDNMNVDSWEVKLFIRFPHLLEDYFGFDQRIQKAIRTPTSIFGHKLRRLTRDNMLDDIKRKVMAGIIMIDEPLDPWSRHTFLHDAVIMNRTELFDFLLVQGANPMVRDTNGYTPLLKAAALGRMEMVKALVEVCGVDPRHVDPYGVTPREKALLYLRHDVAEYLQEMERKAAKGELKLKSHTEFKRTVPKSLFFY